MTALQGVVPSKHQRIERTKVTPSLARRWIESGFPESLPFSQNRQIRQNRVDFYAKQMKAGEWICDGNTIKLNSKEQVLDGQHRLLAIVSAGVPVWTWVAYNMPDNAILSTDDPMRRTVNDVVRMLGRKNSTVLSHVLQLLYRYERSPLSIYQTGVHTVTKSLSLPNIEVIPLLDRLSGIDESVAACCTQRLRRALAPGHGAFIHYLIKREDEEFADEWLGKMISGVGMQPPSALFACRNRLMTMKERQLRTKQPVPAYVYLATAIKGWNWWITGREVEKDRSFVFHPAREKLPKFITLAEALGDNVEDDKEAAA